MAKLETQDPYRELVKQQIIAINRALTKVMYGDFTPVVRSVGKDQDLEYLCIMINVAINAARNAVKERQQAQELEKVTRELQDVQYQLAKSEKMSAIGLVAASVAHEVKNPLGIIVQGISYLKTCLEHGKTISLTDLDKIEKAATRADESVLSLLDLSRWQKLDVHQEDIHQMIEESLNLVAHVRKQGNVQARTFFEALTPMLWIDRRQMTQVLVNLFLNAMDAMPTGGELSVKTHIMPLPTGHAIFTHCPDNYAERENVFVCDIQDTGMGISPENITHVFEPLFSTKPATTGRGLGLSICKTIVENHLGSIELKSYIGKGTQVSIVLPTEKKSLKILGASEGDR